MKRFGIFLITCIFIISFNLENTAAGETDPYTIYGTVEDGHGNAISGAVITVTNENTDEKNTVGNDTVTGSPIPVITDIDGRYTFELTNLKSSYSYGDTVQVTAKLDDNTNSNSVILIEGYWGSRADITLDVGRENDDASSFDSLSWVFAIIIVIMALALIAVFYRRHEPRREKAATPEDEEESPPPPTGWTPTKEIYPTTKKDLPLPPPGWKPNDAITSPTKEEEPPPPDDEEPPPPDDEESPPGDGDGHSPPEGTNGSGNIATSSYLLLVIISMYTYLMIFRFFQT